MKLAVICALREEIAALTSRLESPEEISSCGVTLTRGRLGKTEISIALSGIGKTCAAAAVQWVILREAPDCLLNIGLAGGCVAGLSAGNAIVADRVCYHDFDLSISSQFDAIREGILPNPALRAAALAACADAGVVAKTGTVASGDVFVEDSVLKKSIIARTGCACVDMEAAAIAHVCTRCALPFATVKILSDAADENASSDFDGSLAAFGEESAAITAAFAARLESF